MSGYDGLLASQKQIAKNNRDRKILVRALSNMHNLESIDIVQASHWNAAKELSLVMGASVGEDFSTDCEYTLPCLVSALQLAARSLKSLRVLGYRGIEKDGKPRLQNDMIAFNNRQHH